MPSSDQCLRQAAHETVAAAPRAVYNFESNRNFQFSNPKQEASICAVARRASGAFRWSTIDRLAACYCAFRLVLNYPSYLRAPSTRMRRNRLQNCSEPVCHVNRTQIRCDHFACLQPDRFTFIGV